MASVGASQPGPLGHLAHIDSRERALERRIVVTGTFAAISAAAVQTTCHLLNAFVLDDRYRALEADAQGNVFDWVSAMAIAAAASTAIACAVPHARRLTYGLSGALLAYLSVDELAGFHERLGTAIAPHLPGPLSGLGDRVTPLIYLPLIGTVFVLLWVVAARGTAGAGLLRWGLGLLTGAILIRLAAAGVKLAGDQVSGPARDVGAALDQAFQLAAWLLVAAGLAARLPALRVHNE